MTSKRRYVVMHSHGYEGCPARSSETLKQFNELISDANAAHHQVDIIDRYVDDDCTTAGKSEHYAYFLVEAPNESDVLGLFNPIGAKLRPVVAWKDVQKAMGL
jgi:hypothetical protein